MARVGERDESGDWRDDAEADKLRDEAFRRLLDVPPKPQKDVKLGRPRRPQTASKNEPPDSPKAPP